MADPIPAPNAPRSAGIAANPTRADALDPTGDPIVILEWLAKRLEGYIADLECQPLPEKLLPHQIEQALLYAIRSATRTTGSLARLLSKAADTPQSHAYDEAIIHLQRALERIGTRIASLEARRQPDQIPWLRRQSLLERQEAALERLRDAQVRLKEQQERYAARRQERELAAELMQEERAFAAELAQQEQTEREMLEQLHKGKGIPLAPTTAHMTSGRAPTASALQPPETPAPSSSSVTLPRDDQRRATLARDLVRVFDPNTPTGWRLVPRGQVPKGARILPSS
jgi:hypothetical protein